MGDVLTHKPSGSAHPLSGVIPPQFDRYGWTYWVPSLLESNMAIICASLPALKPLVDKYGRDLVHRILLALPWWGQHAGPEEHQVLEGSSVQNLRWRISE